MHAGVSDHTLPSLAPDALFRYSTPPSLHMHCAGRLTRRREPPSGRSSDSPPMLLPPLYLPTHIYSSPDPPALRHQTSIKRPTMRPTAHEPPACATLPPRRTREHHLWRCGRGKRDGGSTHVLVRCGRCSPSRPAAARHCITYCITLASAYWSQEAAHQGVARASSALGGLCFRHATWPPSVRGLGPSVGGVGLAKASKKNRKKSPTSALVTRMQTLVTGYLVRWW